MKKTTVIFNPTAGQGSARRQWPKLRRNISRNGHVCWQHTRSPGDGERLSYEAATAGAELIIAAGGDGTVHEVVNGLMRANGRSVNRPILATLPLGSANDFATGLNIRTLNDGFERLSTGHVRRIDIGCIRSRMSPISYFCFSGGIGFLATVAFERNKIRHIRGPWLYMLSALRSMMRNRVPIDMAIKFDQGEVIERHLLLLSVNISPTVGGFPLAPAAVMDDGLFDVILAKGTTLARMLRLLLEARRGTHLRFPEFQMRQVSRISIRSLQSIPIHLDGQIYCSQADHIRQLDIWQIPRGLKVLA
jgi:diacylglycerol kinase (ATP)